MRFLHAADIHLDSPMAGLAARGDLDPAIIRDCTRRAFSALVDLAIAEDVAFLVIAGDLYDRDWRDFSVGLFFAGEMRRLGRPCFVLNGNHDAHSVVTRHLTPPPNVRVFPSERPETFVLPELRVALHGQSFAARAVPEDLSAAYPPPHPGHLNVGVLHTSGEDPGEHDVYAPCSVARLRLHGYDYWALGHIHARRVLSDDPPVVFPGNLQGRHARETGPKGATLVTVDGGRVVALEHRTLDVLRWAALEVDAGADLLGLGERLERAVAQAVAGADGRPLLLRLTLTGRTALHGRLHDDLDRLAAEAQAAGLGAGGRVWVEKVRLRTSGLPADDGALLGALRPDYLAGLDDPEVVEALRRDLGAVLQRLPPAARREVAWLLEPEGLARLAEDGWASVADALR